MNRELRILTFTSLYPSASRPRHGIFIESRLKRLIARGGVQARVVAPVPWFPLSGGQWGEYGRMAATPRGDRWNGTEVHYPRYLMLPRISMGMQPDMMARSGLREIESLLSRGENFDLIDAHYLYPDGVAAAIIARRVGIPLVVSARGSDVNLIAQLPRPRRRILEAIEEAAAVIAVSSALKSSLIGMGVPGERITVLRNGVDSELFRPENRLAARRELGLAADARIVISVGNLVAGKRNDIALEAASRIEGLHIIFVGRGGERARLERLAHERSMSGRVRFFDEMPQDRLRLAYSAADVLVLASEREGWPNVLLESASCGTPVIAFDIGGVPEILADRAVGTIVRGGHDAGRLADAICSVLAQPPVRETVRAAAIRFSWEPVLDAQLALYRRVTQTAQTHTDAASPEAVRA